MIVAAHGDPGLFGAREMLDIPIVGVSQAATLTACMLGTRFVVTRHHGHVRLAPGLRRDA